MPPTTAASKPITMSDLTYITSHSLASLLLSPSTSSKTAIIDVRDSDHIGGHIVNSTWIPAHNLELHLPELMRLHSDKDRIVFHCMLSQQRGPGAALRFKRALAEKQRKDGEEEAKGPEVCVLQGGFGTWAARYGKDQRLTENFAADLWEGGGMG